MNQIQKLRNRLATATPAEARTIRELIAELEQAEPDAAAAPAAPKAAPAPTAPITSAQKGNPFLNPRAKFISPEPRTIEWQVEEKTK